MGRIPASSKLLDMMWIASLTLGSGCLLAIAFATFALSAAGSCWKALIVTDLSRCPLKWAFPSVARKYAIQALSPPLSKKIRAVPAASAIRVCWNFFFMPLGIFCRTHLFLSCCSNIPTESLIVFPFGIETSLEGIRLGSLNVSAWLRSKDLNVVSVVSKWKRPTKRLMQEAGISR